MFLKAIIFSFIFLTSVSDTQSEETTSDEIQNVAASDLSRTERSIRDAAVKVERYYGAGYGSGTLMRVEGELVVSTAAHVTGDQSMMVFLFR
jgi:hypothetical protein